MPIKIGCSKGKEGRSGRRSGLYPPPSSSAVWNVQFIPRADLPLQPGRLDGSACGKSSIELVQQLSELMRQLLTKRVGCPRSSRSHSARCMALVPVVTRGCDIIFQAFNLHLG